MAKAGMESGKNWQCFLCSNPMVTNEFTQHEFTRHLRDRHCSVEGGSFVCRYGYNGVCSSLPLDGVSNLDYETHVQKYHIPRAAEGGEPKWSVFSAAQNLPAVLNDPSRGKQTNFFTKKWGDSFVERSVPVTPLLVDVKWSHFDTYLKRIGKRYRKHERFAKMSVVEASPTPPAPLARQLARDEEGSLSDIPEIFMKNDVEFWNPTTFVQVFPGIGGPGDGEATTSGRLLQEKLSHYLDIVEVQIAKQVSQKSSAFFHAMTTQDTIMEQMRAAVANVKKLRARIRHLDETVVRQALHIVSCQRLQTNKRGVLEKLKLMATVHQTQPMIQLLLGTQDYVAALDLIATAQEILAQELTSIHCFRHLPSQLTEMEKLIDKMLTTDFERYSMADLNRPLVLPVSDDDSADAEEERTVDDDKLISIVAGLLRQKNFGFVETYKDDVITTVRAVVKQLVIEVIATSDVEVCLTGAGEEAQSLSLQEWIVLLTKATKTLLKLLKRVKLVHDLMRQTADLSAGRLGEGAVNGDAAEKVEEEEDELNFTMDSDIFLLPSDHTLVIGKLSSLLDAVCNYCHERCANLVSNQSLEKSTPTIDQLVRLTTIVSGFTEGCERICGVQCHALQSALNVQGARFVQKFHGERKSKLALILDSERWRQADVPAEFQKIIDSIARDDFGWTKTSNTPTTSASPVLIIDGQPFALVGVALILVQIVSEYCHSATQLPALSAQISRNVVDLLRTFNSRCCQLVLGAGALHLAGLKTITSTNLALVSRALQLVLWLLPHIKSHFRSFDVNGNQVVGNGTTALTGYDAVEKDFASHIKEVENKILMIVVTLLTNQLDQWEAKPPVPSQPFRTISRHFVKLHEAIAPILPEQQVHSIYRTVNKNFKDKLREQLLKNNIANNGGPQHGVVISELTFYLETLRTLKTMPAIELHDDSMNDIWL